MKIYNTVTLIFKMFKHVPKYILFNLTGREIEIYEYATNQNS